MVKDMVSLNKLTIPFLKELAKECKVVIKKEDRKSDMIKRIENSGIGNKRLQSLFEKYYSQYKSSRKKGKTIPKKPKQDFVILEERIRLLEEQVKFLMSKIGGVEVKLAREITPEIIGATNDLVNVKNIIKSKILPGDSITIDELTKLKDLQNFSITLIEQAINDLIDDEIFDASEGYSIQKIGGNIGLLMRR